MIGPVSLCPDGALDIDALLTFHRAAFGDTQMYVDPALDIVRTNREAWRSQRDQLAESMQSLLDGAEARGDARLNASEQRRYGDMQRQHDEFAGQVDEASTRIEELLTRGRLGADAAAARVAAGDVGSQRISVNESNPVYRGERGGPSFFLDLANANRPGTVASPEAAEARSRLIAAQETRAGDMTTVAGAGGEFAPPAWLVSEFITLARPGRPTADLCYSQNLPSGVSSINLPKVSTGATTAVQATQNSQISDTAMTTTSVTSGITTLAGQQIVAMQLIAQSPVPFDRVILGDLAADYSKQLDLQILYGANGSGQLDGLVNVANNTAFTTASPAPASVTNANSLYYTAAKAQAALWTSIFKPADAIIMHPQRWAWILGSVDANGRPFIVPEGNSFNPVGAGQPVAQGVAGSFCGLPVVVDPNIKTNANSTTNQDECYIVRSDEVWLYETEPSLASFDATFANNLSILFRVVGYAAFLPARRSGAVQSIRGSGLVTPA